MEKAGLRIAGYTLASLRKAQAVCVFTHAISGCFVFTDVLTVVEEDQCLLEIISANAGGGRVTMLDVLTSNGYQQLSESLSEW